MPLGFVYVYIFRFYYSQSTKVVHNVWPISIFDRIILNFSYFIIYIYRQVIDLQSLGILNILKSNQPRASFFLKNFAPKKWGCAPPLY